MTLKNIETHYTLQWHSLLSHVNNASKINANYSLLRKFINTVKQKFLTNSSREHIFIDHMT